MCALLLIAGTSTPAAADDWTPWYALSDGYKGRIDVRYQRSSIKAADGRCDIQYQFRNRYSERASFAFKIITDGGRVSAEGRQELGKGESSWSAANVHSTKEIWVDIKDLHAAGSHTRLPAAD
jgi:hypothetical protein